jgi:hypothetical protein
MNVTGLHRQTLLECAQDYVGLWSIIWSVNGGAWSSGQIVSDDIRKKTLAIVSDLLEARLIQAGFPTSGRGFDSWDLPTKEALARIETQWDTLARTPNIGEVVWFTTTERGDQKAREIAKQDEKK